MLYGLIASAVAESLPAPGPVVLSITPAGNAGSNSSNTTGKVIDLPAVAVGDRLVMVLAIDNEFGAGSISSPPSGWTDLVNGSDGVNIRRAVYYLDAPSDAVVTTVGLTLSAGQYLSGHTYRIQAGTFDDTRPPEATQTPSWGLADTLWIAGGATDQNPGISSYPFANGQTYLATGGTSGDACASFSCWERNATATNDDAGFSYGGSSNRLEFRLAIAPPGLAFLVTYDTPSAVLNYPYSSGVPAVWRGAAPYAFTVHAGTLPDGLTLNASTGEIEGYPTEDGTFPVTIRCADDDAQTFDVELSLLVEVLPLEVDGTYTDAGTTGESYFSWPTFSYGRQPYAFTLQAGALPPGLDLEPDNGYIAGLPTTEGSYSFTVRFSDDDGSFVDVVASIDIEYLPLEIDGTYGDGQVAEEYDFAPLFHYGRPPYVFSLQSGSLPPGVDLDLDYGSLYGFPTTPGTYGFTVRCTDDDGNFEDLVSSVEISA